jgi:thiamine biosynthesis protein ThiC
MRQTIQIKLLMIFTIALISIALNSTARAQINFAGDSAKTALAPNGGTSTNAGSNAQDVCEQRLLKTLDALDKAEKALSFAVMEIGARKNLDALKDQVLAVKDLIIAEYQKLVEVKDKKIARSNWQKFFHFLEKAAMVAAGILLGAAL